MKSILILSLFLLSVTTSYGQVKENYSDMLLTRSFKTFQSADFEMAYHILPFLRDRFTKELRDTTSFSNPYDSLSNYIGIRYSSDSLLKTYCFSERNGSCCHTSATFAQFRTKSGQIDYLDLEVGEEDGVEVFITDLQTLNMNNKTYYLLLGWGTCCGGKHYQTVRMYEIMQDSLRKCTSVFEAANDLYIGANRSQEIELTYSPDEKILSYNEFEFDDVTGFYTPMQSEVRWKVTKDGFIKLKSRKSKVEKVK